LLRLLSSSNPEASLAILSILTFPVSRAPHGRLYRSGEASGLQ
jgi:hypothetical protein